MTTTTKGTARFVRNLPNTPTGAHQELWELDPPLDGHTQVITTARADVLQPDYSRAPELALYTVDADGGLGVELDRRTGWLEHDDMLRYAGYTVPEVVMADQIEDTAIRLQAADLSLDVETVEEWWGDQSEAVCDRYREVARWVLGAGFRLSPVEVER